MRVRCALALALVLLASSASAANRPNIVILMAEDLSPRLGAYGDRVAVTPRIDRLAEQGTRYTRAFTTAGVCAASRAAIIMGVHQNQWGAGHMRVGQGGYAAVPPPDWKAFPELLRAAGYYTINNDKTDYQLDVGLAGTFSGPFSIWDENGTDDWSGRAEGQPFFAYLTLGNTHESQVWPTWRVRSGIQLLMFPMRLANHLQWPLETDPATVSVPPYYPDTPTVRADIARHYNNIARMDEWAGEILDRLEADGLADDTLVIFTTDHGDGLPRAKRWLYDSGIHIPLIVRWPGHDVPGSVNEELVSGVDFARTFLSLAGAPIPAHMQGRIFLGEDREAAAPYVYAARDRMDERPDTVRAVRDTRFKYIRNLRPELPYVLDIHFRNQMPMTQEMIELAEAGELEEVPALWFRPTRDSEELYDLGADPHEIHNLAASETHADDLVRLRAALDAWLARDADLGLLPEEELRERFWPGGEQPETAPPHIEVADGRARVRPGSEGASIGIEIDGGPSRLYTGPVALESGRCIEARSIRYGWAESPGVSACAP